MKQIITAKLKLQTDAAQSMALRATQLAYRAALNSVSRYSFEHGKMSNQRALQRECFLREERLRKLSFYSQSREANLLRFR